MADQEVFYARSAYSRGSGIPRQPHFTLWPRIYLSLALTSSSLRSAYEKASLRSSSIEAIRVPTQGKVFCRYCHSIWSNTPKSEYSDWG